MFLTDEHCKSKIYNALDKMELDERILPLCKRYSVSFWFVLNIFILSLLI